MSHHITNDHRASGLGYHWEPDQVVEVDDAAAAELLSIKDAGFREVAAPVPEAKPKRARSRTADGDAASEDDADASA